MDTGYLIDEKFVHRKMMVRMHHGTKFGCNTVNTAIIHEN